MTEWVSRTQQIPPSTRLFERLVLTVSQLHCYWPKAQNSQIQKANHKTNKMTLGNNTCKNATPHKTKTDTPLRAVDMCVLTSLWPCAMLILSTPWSSSDNGEWQCTTWKIADQMHRSFLKLVWSSIFQLWDLAYLFPDAAFPNTVIWSIVFEILHFPGVVILWCVIFW